MKTMFAMLLPLMLAAGSSAAEQARPTVPRGSPMPAAQSVATGPVSPWKQLDACGKRWNDKLRLYQQELPALEAYEAYREHWNNHPAQRAPKPAEPFLTRASYRACMYQCLGDDTMSCPGGWPVEGK